jgi:preprotein translocase subunit SecF
MKIISYRKVWFILSGLACLISLVALLIWGFKLSVDFTGGTLMEIRFQNNPEKNTLEALLKEKAKEVQIQVTENNTFIIRMELLSEEKHQEILSVLKEKFGELTEERFESIGPTIGQELKRKSILAIIIVTIMVLLYIAWAFRHVSHPVPSIVYGVIVVLTFLHDVIIPLGVFAFLGHFRGVEIGSTFIPAILTILGYSINDTIVVLDRVRENLRRMKASFEEIVETSVQQTITRSINTSLTTILSLLAVYLFGGESIKTFALALMIGIFVGTYSSIFIASPLLVVWQKYQQRH